MIHFIGIYIFVNNLIRVFKERNYIFLCNVILFIATKPEKVTNFLGVLI